MNKDYEEKFGDMLETMRGTSLTNEERNEMRSSIRLFMSEYPVKATFRERFFVREYSMPRVSFMRPALAGFLIVFLVGGGASYAAADALPGDILYTVKTNVNEPLQGILANSDEEKADWNALLASRRLEEAGALALQGRLTTEARAEIETRFEELTQKFEAATAALAQKKDGEEATADAQSYMEISLKTHADVLEELAVATPGSEVELNPILEKVRSRAQTVENARIATEEVIAAKFGANIERAAETKRRIAEREVESEGDREVATAVRTAKLAPQPATEAMMTMTMSAELSLEDAASTTEEDTESEAAQALREGSEKLQEGKHGEAFTSFQKALRSVEQKKLESDIRKRLKFKENDESDMSKKDSSQNKSSNENDSHNSSGPSLESFPTFQGDD